jgi:hemerythrin-like metal-binding protein|tara:strand:- start:134 stop:535 length:402 start_codon:yes stop_codon:yes gene_type:complete
MGIPELTLTPDMLTHVPKMDEQHRVLVKRINDVISAINDERQDLSAELSSLMAWIEFHFDEEETYQQSVDARDFVVHQATHKSLIRKFRQLCLEHEEGTLTNSHLGVFFKMWLRAHIKDMDVEGYGKPAAQEG